MGMHAQAAMSMCEGNPLSAHLVGDAIALAAAAAQAPWLCRDMCTGLGHFCCSSWVVMQASSSHDHPRDKAVPLQYTMAST